MEALNNSLKHARATDVTVRLTSEANWVELEIIDNGCGFNVHSPRIGGMGLITMAERAERLGGSIKVESTLNMGTKIQFRVDFDRGSAHGSDPGVSG
jgi:signal transduction histidine kinase